MIYWFICSKFAINSESDRKPLKYLIFRVETGYNLTYKKIMLMLHRYYTLREFGAGKEWKPRHLLEPVVVLVRDRNRLA